MEDLTRLLPTLIRAAENAEEVIEAASFVAWDRAVGQPNRRVSAPIRLTNKTLTVAVTDASWKTQFEKLAGQILFKVNANLGIAGVTRIHLVVDPDWVAAKRHIEPAPSPAPLPPPDADLAAAEAISDPELRRGFLRTAGRCLSRTPSTGS